MQNKAFVLTVFGSIGLIAAIVVAVIQVVG